MSTKIPLGPDVRVLSRPWPQYDPQTPSNPNGHFKPQAYVPLPINPKSSLLPSVRVPPTQWLGQGDERDLKLLNEQYSSAQGFVTPIHRLPFGIFMLIFYIIFGDHQLPTRLILLCRWGDTWTPDPLDLCTWAAPDVVRRAVSGMASRLLNITVHTDQDHELGGDSSVVCTDDGK